MYSKQTKLGCDLSKRQVRTFNVKLKSIEKKYSNTGKYVLTLLNIKNKTKQIKQHLFRQIWSFRSESNKSIEKKIIWEI